MTTLVVEDEKQLNTMIRDYLESLGWNTLGAESGTEALEVFRSNTVDFVLLDIMIPGLDGLDVMRKLREQSDVPIILITALTEETDKLIGLELGADDYISKPFSLKEMAARVRAVIRRVHGPDDAPEAETDILKVGELELDASRRIIRRAGTPLEFTAVQFDIIHGFMKNPGRVFKRTEILEFFQEHAWEGYDRTIDVHIKNIRKILEPDRDAPRYIQTVRSVGYRLNDGKTP